MSNNILFYFYTICPIIIIGLSVFYINYYALIFAPIHLGLLFWLSERMYKNDIKALQNNDKVKME